jgi:cellulose synthase/poly-beta-1,6-N-acetylglucosamine synthase-like glycosyltransferase
MERTDNKPFVSIIIPAHNEAKNLPRCIQHIRDQDYPKHSYEIIVVDNNSQDNTQEVLKYLDVRVVTEKRKSRTIALNTGIKASRGEIIIIIDADCLAEPEWLKAMVSAFKDPEVGCAAGEIRNLCPDTPFGRYLQEKGYLSQRHTLKHPFLPYAEGANQAFRREVFDKIGLFDENLPLAQDADICWRMQLKTDYKIKPVFDAVVLHCQKITPRIIFEQRRRHGYSSVLIYEKYKKYRQGEIKTFKETYWEYHSIIRRWLRLLVYKLKKRLKGADYEPPPINEYQLLLETAYKIGRLEGSLKHRVWYP